MEPDPLPHYTMTATYSPEDNKLRLYTATRLDADTYTRVKAAGFKWAPKQELFVAPMWTPERAALLVELCGEIDDEDKSLCERAEERADRFEEYSDHREADAHRAHEAVAAIANNIPLGQPILVGHHSEKHARKDAKRIENGMRKAVKMWETAKYWTDRAKGALRHAKYKELPGVRHRRIKGLEADKRKQEKKITNAENFRKLWSKEGLTLETATKIANFDHCYMPKDPTKPYNESLWSALNDNKITAEDAAKLAIEKHDRSIERARTWLAHIVNRLAYERAMLDEGGGIAADNFPIEVGGRVLVCGWRERQGYLVVLKVNRTGGAISSVRTTDGVVSVEEVKDYRPPEPGDAEKVKKATKLAPLVNYPGEGFRHMLKAEYDKRAKVSDFTRINRMKATEKHGAHRRRETAKEGGQYYELVGVYLTDAKRVDPPAPEKAEPVAFEHEPGPLREARTRVAPARTVFDDMRENLKAGVAVVSAPQLFPTPPELAARMVREADIGPGMNVLEPSAGTGAIVHAVIEAHPKAPITAVELSDKLCMLSLAKIMNCKNPDGYHKVVGGDFLEQTDLGTFDRVLMNPPFADGADIAHVTHAYGMLRPGGRLVAIMSAGVTFRQDKRTTAFRALVEECGGTIEKLPDGTFKESGTNVSTVIVTMEAK